MVKCVYIVDPENEENDENDEANDENDEVNDENNDETKEPKNSHVQKKARMSESPISILP